MSSKKPECPFKYVVIGGSSVNAYSHQAAAIAKAILMSQEGYSNIWIHGLGTEFDFDSPTLKVKE